MDSNFFTIFLNTAPSGFYNSLTDWIMGGKKKRSHQSYSPATGKKHKQSGTQSKGKELKDVAADGATGHGRKLDSSSYM